MSGPVNIDSRGYGKIYKAVMRNRDLPLLAKTIYAYFCAYAGNGVKAFPKRDKIVHDLQINKDTYTKHLNRLVEDGYISKERTSSGNIYTIMQTIPAYDKTEQPPDIGGDGDDMTDMLRWAFSPFIIGIKQSFSRVGMPGDNAWAESFFATLKKEYIHFQQFTTREAQRQTVFAWINGFYNTKRVQKRLGYLTPREYAASLRANEKHVA